MLTENQLNPFSSKVYIVYAECQIDFIGASPFVLIRVII